MTSQQLNSNRPLSHKPSLVEIKTEKYAQLSLPFPDESTISKYFTENAQEEYHQKYKKLLHQAELLSGGKRELLETVIAAQDPTYVAKKTDLKILKWGFPTPDSQSISSSSSKSRCRPSSSSAHSKSMPLLPINKAKERPRTAGVLLKSSSLFHKAPVRPHTSVPEVERTGRNSSIVSAANDIEDIFNDDNILNGDDESKELQDQSTIIGKCTVPHISVPKQNNFFSNLDDDESDQEDNKVRNKSHATELVGQSSPRSVFLAGCVRYGLPPRSVAMLRKRISPILNIAHMSIGNQMAILLAEALDKMPYLQALNLADNNLDDIGLSAVIRSVAKHSTLEVLDISQNIMDDDASKALAAYIGNEQCQLKCLRMSSTDIDDKECARFIDVLMNNRQLRELDMSNNLLGKDENLNVVMPDFLTGGESIAKFLRNSTCPLETLNLHWNMIRLEGAFTLCESIRYNSYLTHLDLSYNALGSAAVCALGVALTDNNKLRHLNLASNNIDSTATITLATGMRENHSLCEVILNGNPIGEQGARALMKVVLQEGQRLSIQTQDCDITAKTSSSKLKIDNPIGDYLLNLSEPYERAIAFELFDIIANETFIDVSICDLYYPSYSDSSSIAGGSVTSLSTKKGGKQQSSSSSVVTEGGGGKKKAAGAASGNSSNNSLEDPFSSSIEKLGPLLASYLIVRFDEVKSHSILQPNDHAEESFFTALAPISTMPRIDIVRVVKRNDANHSNSFPVSSLRGIFDELLRPYLHSAQFQARKNQFRNSFFMTSEGKLLDDEEGDEDKKLASLANKFEERNHNDVSAHIMNMMVRSLCEDAQKLLDPRLTGVIDHDVFIDYIIERSSGARDRLRQIRNTARCAAVIKTEASSGAGTNPTIKRAASASSLSRPSSALSVDKSKLVRYIPPTQGWLRLRLTESFLQHLDSLTTATSATSAAEATKGSSDSSSTNNNHDDVPNTASSSYAMTRYQCLKLLEEISKMSKSNPITLLLYAIDTAWIRLEEAQLLYAFAAKKADDPIMVLARILLRMQSGYEARRLVHYCMGDDIMKLRRLKQRLGSVYYPLLNIYSGFYTLDLSNELDRMCLKRLIEKSVKDNAARRAQGLWDTSQYGNWSCFRNEVHRSGVRNANSTSSSGTNSAGSNSSGGAASAAGGGKAAGTTSSGPATGFSGSSGSDIGSGTLSGAVGIDHDGFGSAAGESSHGAGNQTGAGSTDSSGHDNITNSNLPVFANIFPENLISPALFAAQMPTRGRLEFDFVDITRPDVRTCHAIADDAITDCLLLSRLLSEDEVSWATNRLKSMQQLCRRNFLPENAANVYRQDLGRAIALNDHLFAMYNHLSLRVSTRKKAFSREAIATMATPQNPSATNSQGNKARNASRAQQNNTNNKRKQPKRKLQSVLPSGTPHGSRSHEPSLLSFTMDEEQLMSEETADIDLETMRAVHDTVEALHMSQDFQDIPATTSSSNGVSFNTVHESVTGRQYMNGIDQDIAHDTVKGFRSFMKQGTRAQSKLRQWGTRMQEIIRDGRGSDEHKSAALLEYFELELSGYYLECRHVALILELMGSISSVPRSNMGSYRVELVVMLFDRIVDLWHADLLWQVLSSEEQAALIARIGMLNWFNTSRVGGGWSYDMSRWEERQCLKLQIDLSFSEPNQQQWSYKIYHFVRGIPPVPAWSINRNWLTEESLPVRGIVTFEMSLGELPYAHTSPTDYCLRQMLSVLTLSGPRRYMDEIDIAIEKDQEKQTIMEETCFFNDPGEYEDPLDRLLVAKPAHSSTTSQIVDTPSANTNTTTIRFAAATASSGPTSRLPPLLSPSTFGTDSPTSSEPNSSRPISSRPMSSRPMSRPSSSAIGVRSILKAPSSANNNSNSSPSAASSVLPSVLTANASSVSEKKKRQFFFPAESKQNYVRPAVVIPPLSGSFARLSRQRELFRILFRSSSTAAPSSAPDVSFSVPSTAWNSRDLVNDEVVLRTSTGKSQEAGVLPLALPQYVNCHIAACNDHVQHELNGQWLYTMAPRAASSNDPTNKDKPFGKK